MFNEYGLEELTKAVIKLTARDYKAAVKKHDIITMVDIIDFIENGWIANVIDPDVLKEKIINSSVSRVHCVGGKKSKK